MRIYRNYSGLLSPHLGGAIAIGNFDGVHLGHQAVIKAAGKVAKREGLPWGVLTFEPHPREFFIQGEKSFRLTPLRLKARYIKSMGVDFLIVLRFDSDLSKMPAGQFLMEVLADSIGAKILVSGNDFVFGNNREGTVAFLKSNGKKFGLKCESVSQVKDSLGRIISSTRIRECLVGGTPLQATELLGRSFEIEGRVVKGDQRGREIGFPTANIKVDKIMKPALGGYAVRVALKQGKKTVWHEGIANLGYRPTFAGTDCLLETFIFDFDKDIYGESLRVEFVDFIRPEIKFDGVEGLKKQISSDTFLAKKILANKPKENGKKSVYK